MSSGIFNNINSEADLNINNVSNNNINVGAAGGTLNIFNNLVDFSGVINGSNTTSSSDNSTGALKLQGGLSISNTTDAISLTNGGTFTTSGGMSIAKKLFVGGLLTVNGVSGLSHSELNGLLADDHTQYALLAGRVSGQTITGGTASGNSLVLQSTSNVTKGSVSIPETTASTNTTTGALTVAGGVGIAGALNVGGNSIISGNLGLGITPTTRLHVSGNTKITNNNYIELGDGITKEASAGRIGYQIFTTGLDIVGAGTISADRIVRIFNNLTVEDNISSLKAVVSGTTASTSTTTGALTVAGGVGVAGALNVGGNVSITGTLSGIAHDNLTGLLDDDHTQYALLAGRISGQTITGGTASGNSLVLQSTSNATKGSVSIPETTASTSTTTGALTVAGGAGIGGNVYIGGNTVVNGDLSVLGTTVTINTETVSFTDNLLVVNGGPSGSTDGGLLIKRFVDGVSGPINYAGMFYKESTDELTFALTSTDPGAPGAVVIDSFLPVRANSLSLESTTASTSITTGALKVAGGISSEDNIISKNILDAQTSGIAWEDQSLPTLNTAQSIQIIGTSFSYVQNQYIQLTNATNNQQAAVYWQQTPGNSLYAKFDLFYGGGTGADGISFDFYQTSLSNDLKVNSGGIKVVFDELSNEILVYSPTEINAVDAVIVSTYTNFVPVNTWATVHIIYNLGDITVYINGIQRGSRIIQHPETIADSVDRYIRIHGKTGSINNIHRIRNVEIRKNISTSQLVSGESVLGTVKINDATASTNTTTGALTVAGGVGIGGALNVGGNVSIGTHIPSGSLHIRVPNPSLILEGTDNKSPDGDATIRLRETGDSRGMYLKYKAQNQVGLFIGRNQNSTADIDSVFIARTTGDMSIINTTASTSTTTGALTVAGGVGIGGVLNTSKNVNIGPLTIDVERSTVGGVDYVTPDGGFARFGSSGITPNETSLVIVGKDFTGGNSGSVLSRFRSHFSFSSVDGTSATEIMRVNSSGIGIGTTTPGRLLDVSGTARITGVTEITNTTASTSSTTGALTVAGGVGIGGVLNATEVNTANGLVMNYNRIKGSDIKQGAIEKRYSLTSTANFSDEDALTSEFLDKTPELVEVRASITVLADSFINKVCLFKAILYIATPGIYTFGTNSDDCSDIFVDGKLVADWYGIHPANATATAPGGNQRTINLSVGYHVVIARLGQEGGGVSLNTLWKPPGALDFAVIPSSVLYYDPKELMSSTTEDTTIINQLSIRKTTASTSTTTGALTVSGGVGIGGDTFVNGFVNMVGAVKVSDPNPAIELIRGSNVFASNLDNVDWKMQNISGILRFYTIGGAAGPTLVNPVTFSPQGNVGIGTTTPDKRLDVSGTARITGNTEITSTTISTSTGTGALVVSGGLGIGGNLNVGGNLIVDKNINLTGSINGVETSPNISGITGILNIGSVVALNSRLITLGSSRTLYATFEVTPTVTNLQTSFNFEIPRLSLLTSKYSITGTIQGYDNNTETSLNNMNIIGDPVSDKAKIQFTSNNILPHIIQINVNYSCILGRYVVCGQFDGKNERFDLKEIEVYDENNVNIASQSTPSINAGILSGVLGNLIDGDLNTEIISAFVPNVQYTLDFGSEVRISKIIIYDRQGTPRILDSRIAVRDKNGGDIYYSPQVTQELASYEYNFEIHPVIQF